MAWKRSTKGNGKAYASAAAIATGAAGIAISYDSRSQASVQPGQWLEEGESATLPATASYPNPEGTLGVINTSGAIDTEGHPFFEPLGTNGRACVTCHQPANAMSLSVDAIRDRWTETKGADPLFHPSDGANCPDQPRGEEASHSLLLEHGLFRIGLPWPPQDTDGTPIEPEFTLEVLQDPPGCNTSPKYGLESDNPTVSVYRRPRMAANLRYVTTPFSLSGRFNGKTGEPLAVHRESGERVGLPILADARHPTLETQAQGAAVDHMRVHGPLADEQIRKIIEFETQIYVAQDSHSKAGSFVGPDVPPALGPAALAAGKSILPGNNWDTPIFMSFDSWKNPSGDILEQREFRASVARGYDIFFERPTWIRNVAWFKEVAPDFRTVL